MCGPSSDVYKKNKKHVGNGLKATEKFWRNNQIIAYMPITFWVKVFKNGPSKSRSNHFRFFKGCLPQILLGPLLNTLTYL